MGWDGRWDGLGWTGIGWDGMASHLMHSDWGGRTGCDGVTGTRVLTPALRIGLSEDRFFNGCVFRQRFSAQQQLCRPCLCFRACLRLDELERSIKQDVGRLMWLNAQRATQRRPRERERHLNQSLRDQYQTGISQEHALLTALDSPVSRVSRKAHQGCRVTVELWS